MGLLRHLAKLADISDEVQLREVQIASRRAK
jgi:hypothetical protein